MRDVYIINVAKKVATATPCTWPLSRGYDKVVTWFRSGLNRRVWPSPWHRKYVDVGTMSIYYEAFVEYCRCSACRVRSCPRQRV